MPADAAVTRQVRFLPQPEDLVAAARCVYVADNFRSIVLASILSPVGVFALVALFLYVEAMPAELWHGMIVLSLGLLLGLGTLGPLAFSYWYAPWIARRSVDLQRPIPREATLSWDATGVRIGTDWSDTRIAFAECQRWAEARDGIMLFYTDRKCEFVPKRVLRPAQLDDLRRLARQARLRGA